MEGKHIIHYKFRNDKELSSIFIDTHDINAYDLKEKFFSHVGLTRESWNLKMWDSAFSREYGDEEVIPSKVVVVLQRLPRENAPKIAKTSKVEKFHEEKLKRPSYTPRPLVPTAKWNAMSEQERLKEVILQSTEKYSAKYYLHGKDLEPFRRKPNSAALVNMPPPGYVCKICNKSGHFIKECPLKGFKKATGILACELIPCSQDDPLAMLTNDGRFVKRKVEQECIDRATARKRKAVDAEYVGVVPKKICC
ncbi:hypothetical protein QR680_008376 [Steinernema hermaphroditum]|uniref:CCHC-type domain-containing protein n=1 Tax=Steinernema hermaphroditum TaxID=289476 RepID=A0AA39IGD3_9BILA|nr:hypothetical protein QR680_008376 [Steinernema hermaphroditum]